MTWVFAVRICSKTRFRMAQPFLQSTLVISKSKGLSEILRDIRTSTYHICRNEKKVNQEMNM